jgi:hypothetical protein
MRIGDVDVCVRADLEAMIDAARERVREAGLPESAVNRITQLGFHCSEHGTTTTLVVYRQGVIFIYCRTCERQIMVIAVAHSITVLPAVESAGDWN